MTIYFPQDIFTNILSYCNDTHEKKMRKFYKNLDIDRDESERYYHSDHTVKNVSWYFYNENNDSDEEVSDFDELCLGSGKTNLNRYSDEKMIESGRLRNWKYTFNLSTNDNIESTYREFLTMIKLLIESNRRKINDFKKEICLSYEDRDGRICLMDDATCIYNLSEKRHDIYKYILEKDEDDESEIYTFINKKEFLQKFKCLLWIIN